MKKGFTLIELLIVMVLVGVLVTVALPKYYSSMERGRAMEGINNLRAASDLVNSRYIMNDNSYPAASSYTSGGKLTGDFTKSVYFSTPMVTSSSAGTVEIIIVRESGEYTLKATNSDGELKYMTCVPGSSDLAANKKLCENIGFELSGSNYIMSLN
ncbi:MAG: type IV pilin protein [Candidatus Avelusimicrobium sp.]|uniref:type IV pilin protein n=1 Tax=Candidatus Avelusimicrobium sp. TaxID=3048833 RepID=UPI003F0A1B1A